VPVKTATIKFGPLMIHWYGVILVIALLAGLFVAICMARLRGRSADPLAGILLLGLLSGAIGARLWYYLLRRDYYDPDPGRVFAVWEGGLGLHGAIIGGVLATLIYTWSRELDFWTWADICAPALILGQAIGRVGDLVNYQAFGKPMTGPWTVVIPPENRPPQYLGYSHFTPVAAYEGLWDLAVFVILEVLTLLQLRRFRVLPAGTIFLAYLVLYSAGRIPLESMRLDSLWMLDQRAAQLASWVMIAIGLLFYVYRLLPRREDVPVAPPVIHGQPSQAYLAAAARGGLLTQGRLDGVETARLGERPVNGHLPTAVTMPALQGKTVELPTVTPSSPGASGQLPPSEEAS
jgi:phosphatidylglycerol:prolipoprotein diacylglycerol transferase